MNRECDECNEIKETVESCGGCGMYICSDCEDGHVCPEDRE